MCFQLLFHRSVIAWKTYRCWWRTLCADTRKAWPRRSRKLVRGPWLSELFEMRKSYIFLIESERSRNKLFLNGQEIATFATLDAAKAEANKVATRTVPGATLRFELDFKWTLTDLEIRAATLEWESAEAAR